MNKLKVVRIDSETINSRSTDNLETVQSRSTLRKIFSSEVVGNGELESPTTHIDEKVHDSSISTSSMEEDQDLAKDLEKLTAPILDTRNSHDNIIENHRKRLILEKANSKEPESIQPNLDVVMEEVKENNRSV